MDLNADSMRLERLSVPELQAEYAGLTGESVRSRHRGYLTRRILWWLQARAYGGLSERARSLAATLARDGDIRLTPPRRPTPVAHGVPKPRDTRLPRPGRTIEREFAGKVVRVTVLTDGFEYDGKRYRSLTAVAHAVTGGHTNGFRFFGLTP